jgi:hypothetical protein
MTSFVIMHKLPSCGANTEPFGLPAADMLRELDPAYPAVYMESFSDLGSLFRRKVAI